MNSKIEKCPQCGYNVLTNSTQKLIVETLSKKPLKWMDLLTETKLSKGALSKHLNILLDCKITKAELIPGTKDIIYSLTINSPYQQERTRQVDAVFSEIRNKLQINQSKKMEDK